MPGTDDESSRCLIVMYHYVHDPRHGSGVRDEGPHSGVHALSLNELAAQLDRLCASLDPIDWSTFFAATQGRVKWPRQSFLLTFDDGLSDHARHVAPLLESRGLRGTFFVPGAVLAARGLLTAHAIHLLLSRWGDDRFEQEVRRAVADQPDGAAWVRGLDGSAPPMDPHTPAANNPYHYEPPERARLKTWLTFQLPIPLRNRVIGKLFEQHVGSRATWGNAWYVSWDDLTAMQAQGHTIGGHGFAHEPYTRMNQQAQQEDMIQCAQTLSKGLGCTDRPFSYPYGSHDAGTIEACRRAGFVQAFTTTARWARSGDNALCLPRIDTIHVDAHLPQEVVC